MIRARDPPNRLAEILPELGRHQAGPESLGRSHPHEALPAVSVWRWKITGVLQIKAV